MVLEDPGLTRPGSGEVKRFARGRRVTIDDVAARAGVSKTTVSHVLSGKRPVRPDTRRRVERAIRDLDYRTDFIARSLRTRQSQTVALVIPDITNPFFPVLARGFEDALGQAGYRTFVCNTDSLREQELAFVTDVASRGVDGVAMVSHHVHASDVDAFIGSGLPIVTIGSMIVDHQLVDVVMGDDERGARDATDFLLERYGPSIAHISGSAEGPPAREIGYRQALQAAGVRVRPEFVVQGDWTRAGGEAAMRKLLDRSSRPRAVFCANDLMALGALDALGERGLRVPDDVALLGYDDVEWASLVRPPLTTVLNPAYDTGRAAANLLFDRIARGYEGARRVVRITCSLVVRESA
jgi:LacI family transcriptional regulator, galactose operon repressor